MHKSTGPILLYENEPCMIKKSAKKATESNRDVVSLKNVVTSISDSYYDE